MNNLSAGGAGLASEPPPAGELRHAVAMMIDVVDSSSIAGRIGAERGFELIREIVDLCTRHIRSFSGHSLSFTGDGIFALFGAPIAVEKAAHKACCAAVTIRDAMKMAGAGMQQRYGVQPLIRIGLAGGEVFVGSLELGGVTSANAGGPAINLAARIQALAPPGEIACPDDLVAETAGHVDAEPLGAFDLKGFAGSRRLFRIISAQADTDDATVLKNASPFVGRQEQIGKLITWFQSLQGPQVCLISGPPGIGKSRLIGEFAAGPAADRRLVRGSCFAESTTRPLQVLLDMLRHYCTQHENGDVTTASTLSGLLPRSLPKAELLARILDGDAEVRAGLSYDEALTLRQAIREALTALAGRQDVFAVIEDVHWMDDASAEVISGLLSGGPAAMHLLMTAREEMPPLFQADHPPLVISLPHLSRSETIALAGAFLDERSSRNEYLELIADKSEGNPFFAFELARNLGQAGTGVVEASRVGTIQNLAFARFDHLDSEVREILRMAAVLGRSFRLDVLGRATTLPEGGAKALFAASAGLIGPDLTDPARSGAFTHVLWRDVILRSLPERRRAALHLIAGEALETTGGGDEAALSAALLEHFAQSGEVARAMPYFHQASRSAFAMHALQICDGLLDRAFALIEADPEAVDDHLCGEMLELWLRVLEATGYHSKMITVSDRFLGRLDKPGLEQIYVTCLSLKAKGLGHGAQFAPSLRLINTALARAEAHCSAHEVALAKAIKIRILVDSGLAPAEEIERLFHETAAFANDGDDLQLSRLRLFHLAALRRAQGRYSEARKVIEELRALGRSRNDPITKINADWAHALQCFLETDFDAAFEAAGECLKLSIPQSAQWRLTTAMVMVVRMFRGEDIPTETFLAFARASEAGGEANARIANTSNAILSMFMKGKVRDGKTLLDDWRRLSEGIGIPEFTKLSRLFYADLMLSFAGLLPPRGKRPKLSIGDMAMALRLKIGARGRAERTFRQVLQQLDHREGYFAARAVTGLALIARSRRNATEAMALESEARRLCAAEGLTMISRRLDGRG